MFYQLLSTAFFLAMSVVRGNELGTVAMVDSMTKISESEHGSSLWTLHSNSQSYSEDLYVLNLHGTRFQQGFDTGALFGYAWSANYDSLMNALFGELPGQVAWKATEWFLDWQWDDYLSKDVPEEYMQEIAGIDAGGKSAGYDNLGKKTTRGIVLANLPSDMDDLLLILLDEYQQGKMTTADFKASQQAIGYLRRSSMHCSMFGVWGSRTVQGRILSMRNLDWMKSTGISQYKLLTVHHPEGKIAHVDVGFAGLWGTLTGASEVGLSVHEANLESNDITFRGFPWTLRLRYIEENAANINQALDLWYSTSNTVGFNHMIASTSDNKAVVLETMMHNTAQFFDNDEREVNCVDGVTGEQLGFPLVDAVYRTNHGYDDYSIEHFMWNGTHAYESSKNRYMAIYNSFVAYETDGVLIDIDQAVRVTATIGDKGGNDFYSCDVSQFEDGSNVLSVTYDLRDNMVFAAFEDGMGETWSPASCNSYLGVDMNQFFDN